MAENSNTSGLEFKIKQEEIEIVDIKTEEDDEENFNISGEFNNAKELKETETDNAVEDAAESPEEIFEGVLTEVFVTPMKEELDENFSPAGRDPLEILTERESAGDESEEQNATIPNEAWIKMEDSSQSDNEEGTEGFQTEPTALSEWGRELKRLRCHFTSETPAPPRSLIRKRRHSSCVSRAAPNFAISSVNGASSSSASCRPHKKAKNYSAAQQELGARLASVEEEHLQRKELHELMMANIEGERLERKKLHEMKLANMMESRAQEEELHRLELEVLQETLAQAQLKVKWAQLRMAETGAKWHSPL